MDSDAVVSVQGIMPSFHAIVCSNWLFGHVPGSWWKSDAVYPLSVYVLDTFLEGRGGHLNLKPLAKRKYFQVGQERQRYNHFYVSLDASIVGLHNRETIVLLLKNSFKLVLLDARNNLMQHNCAHTKRFERRKLLELNGR